VRPTSKAIYFEIGLICLSFIAALLAIAVGLYVSVWSGLLLFVVLVLGLTSLACNYDAPVVRRLSTEESPLLLSLCRTGFIGRVRRMLRIIPSDPRCRFCQAPVWWRWESDRHKAVVGKPELLSQLLRRAADGHL
jgi:adenylate cyclase